MLKQFSTYVKYSIYLVPFIIFLILKNFFAFNSNLIYIFFLAYIFILFITDASGQQIYNNLGQNLVNNSDREYFKNSKKTGKAQISNIIISKVTNKLAIVISVPYFKGDEFMGVFAATIDMQAVSKCAYP